MASRDARANFKCSVSRHRRVLTPALRTPEHEKLAVYGRAVIAAKRLDHLARIIPIHYRDLRDQLRRAAVSTVLNIAEGAGEFSPKEKARFYRIARRSASECLAIIDLLKEFVAPHAASEEAKDDLLDVSAMLTNLIKSASARGE